MNPQPMIAVDDVQATSGWYQQVLGLASGHGGPEYEQLMAGDVLVLQLHRWDADEHGHLGDPARKPYGNGVLLWFHEAVVVQAYDRAVASAAEVVEPLHVNPLAHHREFSLRDPNGYIVVVSGDHGDLG
jgi:catechol 2,3-dioxygenase-like lactoylglutathione lyase family enzyme